MPLNEKHKKKIKKKFTTEICVAFPALQIVHFFIMVEFIIIKHNCSLYTTTVVSVISTIQD